MDAFEVAEELAATIDEYANGISAEDRISGPSAHTATFQAEDEDGNTYTITVTRTRSDS
jgi:hypothetical protein